MNAFTFLDWTTYFETMPADKIDLALRLEADRMATLRIDSDVFMRERDVVMEERRLRVENQPYGRLSEIITDQAFTVHPYRYPIIGHKDSLSRLTQQDLLAFARRHYVSDNMLFVLVGIWRFRREEF